MERLQVQAADGRRLEVQSDGPADGRAVLFHVGTPSAGILYPPLVELGAERGLRHITYSRPGYGGSERRPGRTVADGAADVEAIADALGIARFFTVGWSGGGPHALACAALLGERTIAAATLAGVAPRSAAGLDWLDGMGEENLAEFGAAEAGEQALEQFLRAAREEILAAGGAEIQASLGELLSPVDRAAASGEFAEYLAALFHGALRDDVWGWFDDDLAFVADWGFSLEADRAPGGDLAGLGGPLRPLRPRALARCQRPRRPAAPAGRRRPSLDPARRLRAAAGRSAGARLLSRAAARAPSGEDRAGVAYWFCARMLPQAAHSSAQSSSSCSSSVLLSMSSTMRTTAEATATGSCGGFSASIISSLKVAFIRSVQRQQMPGAGLPSTI